MEPSSPVLDGWKIDRSDWWVDGLIVLLPLIDHQFDH